MRKYITKSLILIKFSTLPFFFGGCGEAKQSIKTRKDSSGVGEATSIVSSSAISTTHTQELNQQISAIIKTHLVAINTKEATALSKETQYCQINGSMEIENSAQISEHISQINFHDCQDDETLQSGVLEVIYNHADEDGKHPTEVTLTAHENYYYNNIELGDHTIIEIADIQYEGETITSLTAKTSGAVTLDDNGNTFNLQNFTHRISF